MDSEEDWESDAGQVILFDNPISRRDAPPDSTYISSPALVHGHAAASTTVTAPRCADTDTRRRRAAAARQGFARVSSSESEASAADSEDGPSAPDDGGEEASPLRPHPSSLPLRLFRSPARAVFLCSLRSFFLEPCNPKSLRRPLAPLLPPHPRSSPRLLCPPPALLHRAAAP